MEICFKKCIKIGHLKVKKVIKQHYTDYRESSSVILFDFS